MYVLDDVLIMDCDATGRTAGKQGISISVRANRLPEIPKQGTPPRIWEGAFTRGIVYTVEELVTNKRMAECKRGGVQSTLEERTP